MFSVPKPVEKSVTELSVMAGQNANRVFAL
jgi:hypothetical protein